jgi:glyceraldehyde 3-phosphate dehydrogenase
LAVRVPVAAGSLADLVFVIQRRTAFEAVNGIFKEQSDGEQYQNILGVANDPFVSSAIIKDSRSTVIDLSMTQVADGGLVKVVSWYDNGGGYASQIIRHAVPG